LLRLLLFLLGDVLLLRPGRERDRQVRQVLRPDPRLDKIVRFLLLRRFLRGRLEHLLLGLEARDVGRDPVALRLLLFLWALLLVRERQPDEGRPVDRSFVLDLRRQSWSDLVERDRRRLERERLVRRGEPGDTPGGDDAGGGDAGRRGDRVLDLFHAGVG